MDKELLFMLTLFFTATLGMGITLLLLKFIFDEDAFVPPAIVLIGISFIILISPRIIHAVQYLILLVN